MTTEQQIATSAEVARRATAALGRTESEASALAARLRVTNPMKSQVLRFEFTAGSPGRAARGANAFAEAYLADRKGRNDAAVLRATRGLDAQILVLNRQLAKDQLERPDAKTAAQSQLYNLQKRVLDIKSRDTDAGDVVRKATAPHLPVGPGLRTLLALGLSCGLLLGLALAWVRSALDTRVRTVGETRAALRAPVLGILPADREPDDELLKVGRTGGARVEAFRALAFRLRNLAGPTGPGHVLVVAPRDAEAAEEVAANLAAALAEYGGEVLLVDADPELSELAARLPLAPYESPTLEEAFLPGGSVLVDADVAGRFAFHSGRTGTGTHVRAVPAEATRTLADTDSATVVVTGPFLAHADALAVAQRVDGVLLVAGLGRTRQDELRQVQELVDCSGGRLLGAVLDTARRSRRPRLLRRRPKYRPAAPRPSVPMELPVQDGTLTAARR